MRRLPARELRQKVATALDMVGLADFGTRFPRELSGGQQQRVALARCLVYQPALILMDEPLGALDRKLREAMQIEIKRLHRDTGATIVFVTHDQDEALALSDRICLMNGGRIEQFGTPQEIYQRPQNTFVADFIGISNVLRGRVSACGGRLVTPMANCSSRPRRPACHAWPGRRIGHPARARGDRARRGRRPGRHRDRDGLCRRGDPGPGGIGVGHGDHGASLRRTVVA